MYNVIAHFRDYECMTSYNDDDDKMTTMMMITTIEIVVVSTLVFGLVFLVTSTFCEEGRCEKMQATRQNTF